MEDQAPPLSRALARTTVRGVRADLLASRQIVLTARDAIGIHRTRVALRRLRAAVSVFRSPLDGDPVVDRLRDAKTFATACGPAREIDVFLTSTLAAAVPVLTVLPWAPEDFAALRATATRLRRTRHDAARAALNGQAFAAFDAAVLDWLERPDADPAPPTDVPTIPDLLDRRHRSIRKTLKRLDGLDPARLHELRLRVKKQHYATSFLGGFFDPVAVRSYIGSTAALQDTLGIANDHTEAVRIAKEIADAARPKGRLDRVSGALCGWLLAAGRRDMEEEIKRAARRFARQARFWRNEKD